jgi:hypothetical protein
MQARLPPASPHFVNWPTARPHALTGELQPVRGATAFHPSRPNFTSCMAGRWRAGSALEPTVPPMIAVRQESAAMCGDWRGCGSSWPLSSPILACFCDMRCPSQAWPSQYTRVWVPFMWYTAW